MKRLNVESSSLDELLGGGVENASITEIYGEPGSGKTNFCLQVARNMALSGKKVAYIDSEGVSLERLRQICNDSYEKVVENILFFNPSSFEEQELMLKNSFKIKNLGMIVLDTYNMFYRLSVENNDLCNVRSLNRQIANLQVEARKKNFYALIVGQVYSVDNDDVKPFSGLGVEHVAKTILKFNKAGSGKRKATIIKHRSQPENKTTFFKITSDGLE